MKSQREKIKIKRLNSQKVIRRRYKAFMVMLFYNLLLKGGGVTSFNYYF